MTASAAVTCLATGLAALPFLFARKGMASHWLGISNAIAAGGTLAASVGLLWQGWSPGIGRLGAGAVLGAANGAGRRRVERLFKSAAALDRSARLPSCSFLSMLGLQLAMFGV